MDTAIVKPILKQEMALYAKKALNAISYLTVNDDETVFAVIDIAVVRGKQLVDAPLVARLDGNRILIERDQNDKRLVDALRSRGVPENQLVLNYQQQAQH